MYSLFLKYMYIVEDRLAFVHVLPRSDLSLCINWNLKEKLTQSIFIYGSRKNILIISKTIGFWVCIWGLICHVLTYLLPTARRWSRKVLFFYSIIGQRKIQVKKFQWKLDKSIRSHSWKIFALFRVGLTQNLTFLFCGSVYWNWIRNVNTKINAKNQFLIWIKMWFTSRKCQSDSGFL